MTADTWKEFDRNPVSHSVAHHITAIAELRETAGYARVSDVAKFLNITRGSVSLTLKTLKQRGLVEEDDNKFLMLSTRGEAVAKAVRSKKFLLQNFLHNVLGVSARTAEEDTCKIEHLVSNATAERLARFLRFIHSNDDRAAAFREAWTRDTAPCEEDPGSCPACNLECLIDVCGDGDAFEKADNMGNTERKGGNA